MAEADSIGSFLSHSQRSKSFPRGEGISRSDVAPPKERRTTSLPYCYPLRNARQLHIFHRSGKELHNDTNQSVRRILCVFFNMNVLFRDQRDSAVSTSDGGHLRVSR